MKEKYSLLQKLTKIRWQLFLILLFNLIVIKNIFSTVNIGIGTSTSDLKDHFKSDISYGVALTTKFQVELVSHWELGCLSYLNFSTFREVYFTLNNYEIMGKGYKQTFILSPFIQYNFDYTILNFNPYIFVGPLWGLNSFKFNTLSKFQNFDKDFKLSFESYGFTLGSGVQFFISNQAVNLELIYNYQEGHTASVIGGTLTRVKTLHSEKIKRDKITEHIILLSISTKLI